MGVLEPSFGRRTRGGRLEGVPLPRHVSSWAGEFCWASLPWLCLRFAPSRLSSHEAADLLGALSSLEDDQGLENAPGLSAGGELFGFSRSRARAFGLGLLSHSGCFLRVDQPLNRVCDAAGGTGGKCLDMCEPSRVALCSLRSIWWAGHRSPKTCC